MSRTNVMIKNTVKSAIVSARSLLKGEELRSNYTRSEISPQPLSDSAEYIPLANIIETNLDALDNRDWRTHFASKLSGKGLEIGPLHRPMVRHDGMDIDYIDRCTVAELREHYPELNELPLVEPDIIGDAETLDGVADNAYDFLISAHVIEHMKNPIGAFKQWARVVKQGGLIYLIVPDKRITFDKQRVRTTLAHMVLDYSKPSDERDFEHYLDYAIHVDGKSDVGEALLHAEDLLARDYSIHFHVFMPSDIVALIKWISANVVPVTILEGPSKAAESDEFHLLVRVD